MSTISKIKVGGTDYDIRDGSLHGLGTKIDGSTNINNLTTADTRYYFSGDDSSVPTNSPTYAAYRLSVMEHPVGANGNVIQRLEGAGFAVERTGFPDGSTYRWGAWDFVNCIDSGWEDVNDYLMYRQAGSVVTVRVHDYPSSSGKTVGTLPLICRPSATLVFAGVYDKTATSVCAVTINTDGTVVTGDLEKGGSVDATMTFVVDNDFGI